VCSSSSTSGGVGGAAQALRTDVGGFSGQALVVGEVDCCDDEAMYSCVVWQWGMGCWWLLGADACPPVLSGQEQHGQHWQQP
jgi:hypothetical protein